MASEAGFEVICCHRIARRAISPAMLRMLMHHVKWADVVHLHEAYSFPTIPTMIAARLFDRPLVWMPHGGLQRWARTRRQRLKKIWEMGCRVAAPARLALHMTSRAEADDSAARFPNVTMIVIPNGVEVLTELPIKKRGSILRVGFIGRLNEIKGIENLLAACRLVKDGSGLALSVDIAGTGEPSYEDSLRRKIIGLGVSDTVRMVGEVRGAAKADFFARHDVIVLPSHTENFGIVVAEALAHGVPVIASRGTPWAQLETKECGLWVYNDPASIASATERIATMPLDEMGARGRRWMEELYSWDRATDELLDLYGQMIGQSSRPALAVAD